MKYLRNLSIALAVAMSLVAASYVAAPLAQSIGNIVRAQLGTPNGPSISSASDTTAGLYFGTGFFGATKHVAAGTGAVPGTCSGCTLVANSSDFGGQFTTTSTSGYVLFGSTYAAAPSCVLTPHNSTSPTTYNTTTLGLSLTTVVNSTIYDYICVAKAGG